MQLGSRVAGGYQLSDTTTPRCLLVELPVLVVIGSCVSCAWFLHGNKRLKFSVMTCSGDVQPPGVCVC
jgi:hypothetical protein